MTLAQQAAVKAIETHKQGLYPELSLEAKAVLIYGSMLGGRVSQEQAVEVLREIRWRTTTPSILTPGK